MSNNTPDYEDNLYFDPQNTKKDLCITSEQLTEKWKKGELPEGYYYCKTENGAEILRTWRGIDGYLNFENMCNEVFISSMDDCEIIAPVPPYEVYKDLIDGRKLLREYIKDTTNENKKLEDLLKECRKEVDCEYEQLCRINDVYETKNPTGYWQLESAKVGLKRVLSKIDEVLR